MRFLVCVLLLASCACAQTSAEIRENEVWLIRGDRAKQLTHDGRAKGQALYSIAFDRVAYFEVCTEADRCTPSVVLLNSDGSRLQSFQPKFSAVGEPAPCGSINSIRWVAGDRRVGIDCHLNPSLAEYAEVDLENGSVSHDLLGLDFTRSPSDDHLAYIAPIVHFAPPFEQSNYLMIDGATVYPLPKGVKPRVGKVGEEPVDTVRQVGKRYRGIHSFRGSFVWSGDSKKVAFFDCISDWLETGVDRKNSSFLGESVGERCWIVAVGLDGAVKRFRVPPGVSLYDQDAQRATRLWWIDHKLELSWFAKRSYRVR